LIIRKKVEIEKEKLGNRIIDKEPGKKKGQTRQTLAVSSALGSA
jgi:hypothetical protein